MTGKLDCGPVLVPLRKGFGVESGWCALAMESTLTASEPSAGPIIRMAIGLTGDNPAAAAKLMMAAVQLAGWPHATGPITLIEAP